MLKPVTLERLVKAVNKISTNKITAEKRETAIVDNEGFVYFRADRKMIKVKYNDIIYIESMKDYIKIVRTTEKPLLVKQSMASLEEVLPVNLFLRIHRSYIVAIDKITAFTNHDVETGGIEIPIGRLSLLIYSLIILVKKAWNNNCIPFIFFIKFSEGYGKRYYQWLRYFRNT